MRRGADGLISLTEDELKTTVAESVRAALAKADAAQAPPGGHPASTPDAAPSILGVNPSPRVHVLGEDVSREELDFVRALTTGPATWDAWKFKASQRVADPMLEIDEDASGGEYLVPDEFTKKVLASLAEMSQVYRHVTVIPIRGKQTQIPLMTTKPTVVEVAESVALTESNAVFDTETITPIKLAAISTLSRELAEDSAAVGVSAVAAVRQRLAEALAAELDYRVMMGPSTGFYGLYYEGISMDYSVAGAIGFDPLVSAKWTIPGKWHPGARWVFPEAVAEDIEKLVDGESRPLFPLGLTQGMGGMLLGHGVSLQDDIPDSFSFFGNLRLYHVAMRERLSVSIATQGTVSSTNLWETDSLGIRVVMRVGGRLPSVYNGGITRLTGIS